MVASLDEEIPIVPMAIGKTQRRIQSPDALVAVNLK